MKSLYKLYQWVLEYVRDGGRNDEYLDYWRNLPDPSQVTDQFFCAELAWCIYNAGMAERVVRLKWPALRIAFKSFDPVHVFAAGRDVCVGEALGAIRHRAKAEAVYLANAPYGPSKWIAPGFWSGTTQKVLRPEFIALGFAESGIYHFEWLF